MAEFVRFTGCKTYQSGNAINIVITEYNTLSKQIKTTADKWPIKGLSDGICGVEDFLLE